MRRIMPLAIALVLSTTPAVVLAAADAGGDGLNSNWATTADGKFYIVPLGDTGKVQYRKVGVIRTLRNRPVAGPVNLAAPAAAPSGRQCVPASEWVPPAPAAPAVAALAPAVVPVVDNGPDPNWAKTADGKFYIVPLGDTGKVQYRKVGVLRANRVRQVAAVPAPIAQMAPALPICPPDASEAAGSAQDGSQVSGSGPVATLASLDPPASQRLQPLSQVPTAVPEPGSLALLGMGLIGLGIARRRRPS